MVNEEKHYEIKVPVYVSEPIVRNPNGFAKVT